ncbi:MAG TPA: hypothetical protein VFA99_02510 [Acidobacteriaceae bacterium]|nr:hypothetical protein [Acidobacteriaceae bacterium]
MLQVLITIDTEAHSISKDWKADCLRSDIERDVYGRIDGREVGLDYQLRIFAQHGLKANFMVESLFSGCPNVGLNPLKQIVSSILAGGHDVQLHPHTEWLPHVPGLDIPYRSHHLREFPLHEQVEIIRFAKQQLELAGAPTPIAFRAGGFAANADTLAALAQCHVRYDSSFNPCYENAHLHLPEIRSYGQATAFGAVQELPITVFKDRPSHLRPAQLCAVSFAEMSLALERAERQGWEFAVIVSHSFEMVANRWNPKKSPAIRHQVVDRFEKLCNFLSQNRDRFQTVYFSDLVIRDSPERVPDISGSVLNTGLRLFSQTVARIRP